MTLMKPVSLAGFLRIAKAELLSAIKARKPVTLVVGNQSADLDSFTSSVTFAYFRSRKPPVEAFTSLYIPLLNIPAADVAIRSEFHALFKHAAIEGDQLITLDDLGPPDEYANTLPPERTRWIIVDHNKLEGKLGEIYGDRVHGMIDHHVEEHAVRQDTDPEPRVVEPVGSCTSLVVREFMETWNELDWARPVDSAQIARFALASIQIDTRNLGNPDKTRQVDIDAAEFLKAKIAEGEQGSIFEAVGFFKQIDAAKKDLDNIPAQGVFRKDYKQWTEKGLVLGTSSSVKKLEKLAKKVSKEQHGDPHAWANAVKEFMGGRNLDLWLVLTSFTADDGTHLRQLALHWAKPDHKKVVDAFEQRYGGEFQLKRSTVEKMPADEKELPGLITWLQYNSAASRKQVAPALREVMRQCSAI